MNKALRVKMSPLKHYRFPVIPVFTYRKKDKYNPLHLGVQWLNLSWHHGISPDISAAINISGSGISTRFNLAYSSLWIHWVILPEKIEELSHRYLWRKGTNE